MYYMKRLAIVLTLLMFSWSSMAAVAIYKGHFKTVMFKTKNDGNERKYLKQKAYLLFDYNNSTKVITDAYLIKYWRDGGKVMSSAPFEPTMTVNDIDNDDFIFAALTQNQEKNQRYESLVSTRVRLYRPISLTIPYAEKFYGTSVSQVTNDLSEIIYENSKIYFKIHKQSVEEYGGGTVADAVAAIESFLETYGYKPEEDIATE